MKIFRIYKGISERLFLYTRRVLNYILILRKKYPAVKNTKDTIEAIIDRKLSVSRFGDGELMIINGSGWGFQKYNPHLATRLKEILKSDEARIAICLPDVFQTRRRFTSVAKNFWFLHILDHLHQWNRLIICNKPYYDTQFTRFYMDLKDKDCYPGEIIYMIKLIWEDTDLLIVEGAGSRLGYGNDLFANSRSIQRIICPAENAYCKYEEIFDTTIKYANGKLVLIALGMTATVLSYDLAMKGFRAIDIGHVDIEYEWFRMKASKKVPVNHKYMNEVSCRIFDEIEDAEYVNQIVASVN